MNYQEYKELAIPLFKAHSPSGYSNDILPILIQFAIDNKIKYKLTNKDSIIYQLRAGDSTKKIGLCAHVDTLGLMVKSITKEGFLKVSLIGSPNVASLDGEYVTIITRANKRYSGTLMYEKQAVHVYHDNNKKREISDFIIRIDEMVTCKEDVLELGINNGDYVAYDPKTVFFDNGFIKSRFLDDKGQVVILMLLVKLLNTNLDLLNTNLDIYFTSFEEVGHGGSSINDDLSELIAVDMACVGFDLDGSEHKVSICAKDSSGPYDYQLTSKLIEVAKNNNIDYIIDLYPFYGSDASAALRAGNNVRTALIGPGVDASHGNERTHYNGIKATYDLLVKYLTR